MLEIARILQLDALLDARPTALSGGQRQRVAMGRAMVREPAAFLMDEPLSNLDAKLRVQMRAEITALQRQLGVTTIYVTHDQTEALTMGDRVAVLKGGRIVAPGFNLPLPANDRTGGLAEGRVIFGIRPADLHDARLATAAGMPAIPAEVVSVEETGAEQIVHLKVAALRVDSGDPDAAEGLRCECGCDLWQ